MYMESWTIPSRFRRIKFPDDSNTYLVGLRVGNEPLLQAILSDGKGTLYACVCRQKEDFKEIFELNDVPSSGGVDGYVVDQMLEQISTFEHDLPDNSIKLTKADNAVQLTLERNQFKLKMNLQEVTAVAEKLTITQQIMQQFVQFSFLQSTILARNQAEIDNKNSIILKLLVDHINNSSTVLGLGDTHDLSEEEIYNHEAVKSMFLRNSGLKESLSSNTQTIRDQATAEAGNVDTSRMLNAVFNQMFDPQWNSIAAKTSSPPYKAPTTSQPKRSFKIEKHNRKSQKPNTLRYLMGRKGKKAHPARDSIKTPKPEQQ